MERSRRLISIPTRRRDRRRPGVISAFWEDAGAVVARLPELRPNVGGRVAEADAVEQAGALVDGTWRR